jgi:hypothetical protein
VEEHTPRRCDVNKSVYGADFDSSLALSALSLRPSIRGSTVSDFVAPSDPIFSCPRCRLIAQPSAYLSDAVVANDQIAPHASDPETAAKLWTISEEIIGEKFAF